MQLTKANVEDLEALAEFTKDRVWGSDGSTNTNVVSYITNAVIQNICAHADLDSGYIYEAFYKEYNPHTKLDGE